jgi:hypothetical protein
LYAFTDDEGWDMLAAFERHMPRDQFVQESCPSLIEVGERLGAFVQSLEK